MLLREIVKQNLTRAILICLGNIEEISVFLIVFHEIKHLKDNF